MSNQKQPEPTAMAGPRLTGDDLLKIALRHNKPVAGYQFSDKFNFEAIAEELNARFFPAPSNQPRPESQIGLSPQGERGKGVDPLRSEEAASPTLAASPSEPDFKFLLSDLLNNRACVCGGWRCPRCIISVNESAEALEREVPELAAPSTTEDVRPTYEQLKTALVIALDGYEPIEKDMGEIADKYDTGGEPEYPNDPLHDKARSIQHHILGLRIFVEETLSGDPMGGPDKTNALRGAAPSKDVETPTPVHMPPRGVTTGTHKRMEEITQSLPNGDGVAESDRQGVASEPLQPVVTRIGTGDVETLVREIANLDSKRSQYAESNWREEYPKMIAAILSRRSAAPPHHHEGFAQHITRFGEGVWDKNCPDCLKALNRDKAGAEQPATKEKE